MTYTRDGERNFLKWLFCKHPRLYWVRNIYGDEINAAGGRRSLWHCPDCKMWQPRRDLYAATGEPPKDHIVDINEKVEGRVSEMSEGEGPDHIHNAVKMIEEPIPHLTPEQYEQILADIEELACNPGEGEDLQLALSRIIQLARKEELSDRTAGDQRRIVNAMNHGGKERARAEAAEQSCEALYAELTACRDREKAQREVIQLTIGELRELRERIAALVVESQ